MTEGPAPFGGGNFFESMMGDLLKLLKGQGAVNWELTRQLAMGVATEGRPEENVDPIERMRLEEIARVAELHVSDATGLQTTATGRSVTVTPATRGQWTWHTLEAWRPLLEAMAESIGGEGAGGGSGATAGAGSGLHPAEPSDPDAGDGDHLSGLLGEWASAMGPMMLAMQFGTTIGHLAQRAMGQYHLPIPRPPSDELLMVPVNISSFAEDWSLPLDDVRLWVCINELAHHAVLSRVTVRQPLDELLRRYVTGFEPDPSALEDRLSGIDPSDPASIQSALGNPSAFLGEMRTPAQADVLERLEAIIEALEGYVDDVLDQVGQRLISSYGPLSEALRRRRVERGEGERYIETLLGLTLGQEQFDRGGAFVKGVVERAGRETLSRMWTSPEGLPTPAEIAAPGLWLARTGLDSDG